MQNINIVRVLLLFFSFSIAQITVAQNLIALDAKYGFREYKFGISSASIPDLIKLKPDYYENKYVAKYKRKNEKLTVGPYRLTSITYRFYKNKLMFVQLTTSLNDGKGILELLLKLYGKPTQIMEVGKYGPLGSSEWFGNKVELSFIEAPRDGVVYIKYMCKPIYDEMFNDEKIEENAIKRRQMLKKQEALKDL